MKQFILLAALCCSGQIIAAEKEKPADESDITFVLPGQPFNNSGSGYQSPPSDDQNNSSDSDSMLHRLAQSSVVSAQSGSSLSSSSSMSSSDGESVSVSAAALKGYRRTQPRNWSMEEFEPPASQPTPQYADPSTMFMYVKNAEDQSSDDHAGAGRPSEQHHAPAQQQSTPAKKKTRHRLDVSIDRALIQAIQQFGSIPDRGDDLQHFTVESTPQE